MTIVCSDRAGQVAGSFGGTCTISNIVVEKVTGATVTIGATYEGGAPIQAKIGDTFYGTFKGVAAAAKRNLTGRFLVVTVTQKSTGISTKFMAKKDPVLEADGTITVNLPLVDDQSGQGVLFSVSVTDEDPVSAIAL